MTTETAGNHWTARTQHVTRGSTKRPGYAGCPQGYGQPAGRVKLVHSGTAGQPRQPGPNNTPIQILAPVPVLWEEQESC